MAREKTGTAPAVDSGWRLAIDFDNSDDIILPIESDEAGRAAIAMFIANGCVLEVDKKGEEWYWPIAQVRSFHIYKPETIKSK